MADNCGQINPMAMAAAQLANMSNITQQSKGKMGNQLGANPLQNDLSLQAGMRNMTLNGPSTGYVQQGGIQGPNKQWDDGIMQPGPMIHQHQQPQQRHGINMQQNMQHQPNYHTMMAAQHHQQQQHAMMAQQQQQQQQMMMMQQQQQQLAMQQQQQQLHSLALSQQHQSLFGHTQQQQPLQQHIPTATTTITSSLPQQNIDQYAPPSSLLSALRQQQQNDPSPIPTEDQVRGGLSNAALEEMTQSNNPKYKNSKFVQFINKLENGEITFGDDDVIDNTNHEQHTKLKEMEDMFARLQSDYINNSGLDDGSDIQFDNNNNPILGDTNHNDVYLGDDTIDPNWQNEWLNYWQNSTEYPPGYDDIRNKVREQMDKYMQHNVTQTQPMDATTTTPLQGQINIPPPSSLSLTDGPLDPQYASKHLHIDPSEDNTALFQRGIAYFNEGRVDYALGIFQELVHRDNTHIDAWLWIGKCYNQVNNDTLTIQALETCLSLDSYNSPALLMLAVAHCNNLAIHTAVTYLYKWLTTHPNYAMDIDTTQVDNIMNDIEENGSSTEKLTQLTHSTIAMFQTLINNHDTTGANNDVDLLTTLGVLYHINRDHDMSIATFSRTVQLDPTNPDLWNKLGAVMANARRNEDALYYYQQALKLRPSFTRAISNVGVSYYNTNNFDQAFPYLLEALSNTYIHQPHLWPLLRLSLSICGHENAAEATRTNDAQVVIQALAQDGVYPDGTPIPGAVPSTVSSSSNGHDVPQ